MPESFTGLGLVFLYPDGWRLDDDVEASAVTLESPSGAFMTITKIDGSTDVQTPVEQARKAMEAEYDEVELEASVKKVGNFELHGAVQRFVYLDLIVTSQLHAFSNNDCTYLVQSQAEDREMDQLQPVFEAMLTSMCRSLESS